MVGGNRKNQNWKDEQLFGKRIAKAMLRIGSNHVYFIIQQAYKGKSGEKKGSCRGKTQSKYLRRLSMNIKYESMVEQTVRDMVKEECLKK